MCGILGWISFNAGRPPIKKLEQSLESIRHRGPDHSGSWKNGNVWLGHRRLSIIDLSDTGNQPMVSSEGRYVIVLNGELYNYRDYIPFLQKKGYPLRSTGDTAVLLGLYTFMGPKVLDSVNGMFALAIWDTKEQRLFLARDRFGKKPLYYHFVEGKHIIFASEMKALVSLLERRTLDGQAVDAYFSFGYIPSPHSIYHEVKKLEAATCLEINNGLMKKTRYWYLNPTTKHTPSDEDIEEALVKSIDLRFVSDVPVGVFLSGGIDSSLITALAAGRLGKKFQTFCMAGGESLFDERPFASIAAKQYGTEHVTGDVQTEDLQLQIERLMPFIDEPFSDSSILPTYLVSRLASQHVKVVLSGEGGDEVFGGYDKYSRWLKVRAYQKMPWIMRRFLKLFEPDINEYRGNIWQSLIKLNRHSFSEDLDVFSAFNSLMTSFLKRRLFSEAFGRQFCSENRKYFHALNDDTFHPYTLQKILDIDRRSYLAEDLMFKADRMSMANSLEIRCPFLDYRLVELAMYVPEKDLIDTKMSKKLLRRIARKWLPETITERHKKGFSVPVSQWFQGRLTDVFDEYVTQKKVLGEILDYDEIKRRYSMHCSGRFDFGNQLWAIMMFHLWWHFHGRGTIFSNMTG